MEQLIELVCKNCGKIFKRTAKEHKRQLKKGKTNFFCGLSCSCFQRNKDNPPKGNIENLSVKQKDEFTPFRWYILRAQYRDRKKKFGCDITKEYLKELWESQNGTCPLTGWRLILPIGTGKAWINKNPANASLDRIDNNKGYVQGNVRFISFMANIGRETFSDEQLIEFCKAVSRNINHE